MNNKDFRKMVLDAVDKVLVQGKQSTKKLESGNRDCAYRGENGTCCPVGFMMDDYSAKLADKLPNGSGIRSVVDAKIWGSVFAGNQIGTLSLLQDAHDSASLDFVENFKDNLINIGYQWMTEHIERKEMENSQK